MQCQLEGEGVQRISWLLRSRLSSTSFFFFPFGLFFPFASSSGLPIFSHIYAAPIAVDDSPS